MNDPRFQTLASTIINHSVRLKAGENILIEAFDLPEGMVLALVDATLAVGGNPHVELRATRVMRALQEGMSEDGVKAWAACDLHRMQQMQAYVGLRGANNANEMSGIADTQVKTFGAHYQKPVHLEQRVKNTKWVVLRWPSPSMAQLAKRSTADFEDYYFRVCCVDYTAMDHAVRPLVTRMLKADRVHIVGPGPTDLRFSIKGVGVVPCCGECNIPDGECYSAPIRDSVEGVLQYNTASLYQGTVFNNIRFEFEKGRIVKATCDGEDAKLNSILDSDVGARYIGEFSLGFNPAILTPMLDTLFDEKIAGSFHFTPGQCYDEAPNGNASQVHWDIVCIQRPDYGGGTVAFDGEVIRRDGLFVVDDLKGLNPDQLATS
ncbi:MAG: aminopeptidase [Phycisphaerales bacterium]|nr:aminopeptidase [Phycisphaerales bacterium]